jgi:hypothetical protein
MHTTTTLIRSLMVPARRLGTALMLMSGLAFFAPRSFAQFAALEDPSLSRLWDVNSGLGNFSPSAAGPSERVPRLRLFRITPGFLADPIGLQDDDTGLPGAPTLSGANLPLTEPDDGPDWIQLGMGADNPYFDLRRPGDPGGFGYYRVNTQVSLLDSRTTACAVGIQAVTPAGLQFGGLQDGPTVVIPAFSVFHAITDRLAIQGFVSKNVPISEAAASPLQRHVQYGLALQRPLLADGPEGLRSLFFTVGAMGQLSPERDSLRLVPNYDVLPGVQWHVNEGWWVSSGVLVPVGPVRSAPGQWQLTCSLQF